MTNKLTSSKANRLLALERSPVWAVLPVKLFCNAKQRLSSALTMAERQMLFRYMIRDTLAGVQEARSLHGIMIVTQDLEMKKIARQFGARVLESAADDGQSRAVSDAAQKLADEGVQKIITLPGDVPLVTGAELDSLVASIGRRPSLTLVPNGDKTGSNSLAVSPPCAIPFAFGVNSFDRHLSAAKQLGVRHKVSRLPGLALDVDVVADLCDLLNRELTTATQHYLIDSGIEDRLKREGLMDAIASSGANARRATR